MMRDSSRFVRLVSRGWRKIINEAVTYNAFSLSCDQPISEWSVPAKDAKCVASNRHARIE